MKFSVYSDAVGPPDAANYGPGDKKTDVAIAFLPHQCEDGKTRWLRSCLVVKELVYDGADYHGPMVYKWQIIRWLGAA